jgi:hypothetical protein
LGLERRLLLTEEDAQAFFDELRFMLAKQMVAPNSPQWFNTGLHSPMAWMVPARYYCIDWKTGKLTKSKSAYEHPQPHACFIQGIEDDPSTRAASWTSGCVKPACSNMARHRLLLPPARRRRAPLRRRRSSGLMSSEDRRPRRGCDQIGRHHAPAAA